MTSQEACFDDWHCKYQDEGYLSLSIKRLDNNIPPLTWCEQFASMLTDELQHSNKVVSIHDIGCNVGHFCRVIPKLGNEVLYRGFDISRTYINIAKMRYPDHKFEILDITKQRPKENSDLSIVSATLEHIDEWQSAFFNILESTSQAILLRTFFGTESAIDSFKKSNATHPYIIRQFTFEQIARTGESRGFTTKFFRDQATESVPQYLGCGVTRTQYIAHLKRNENPT